MTPFEPIFFAPNRVWRCYTGGTLLDDALGNPESSDSHFPENWLASCVHAINGPNSTGPDEGLSRIQNADGSDGPLFRDVISEDPRAFLGSPSEMTLLCKYLDSAVRLPIQCHPDRPFAREYYQSSHGKAESWIVINTREVDGVEPYLLLGFKPDTSEADFVSAVQSQDIEAMERMLHRIPAKPGDVYFIPGRFPHAIGCGVFMLEVQEPSDWVVQPEQYCADLRLSYSDMWGPLDPETALKCFDYTGHTVQDIDTRLRKRPVTIHAISGGSLSKIIGTETTNCFGVDLVNVSGRYTLQHPSPYYVCVVTGGTGIISWPGGEKLIRSGDSFFVPYGLRTLDFVADADPISAYLCLPASDV